MCLKCSAIRHRGVYRLRHNVLSFRGITFITTGRGLDNRSDQNFKSCTYAHFARYVKLTAHRVYMCFHEEQPEPEVTVGRSRFVCAVERLEHVRQMLGRFQFQYRRSRSVRCCLFHRRSR